MIFGGAFTVFALGLRHGADPDHLAAIDAMTRNSLDVRHSLSRFVGTLFAGGHAVMVLAIAAVVGYWARHLTAGSEAIETAGTWISMVVLLLLAVLNVRQLVAGNANPAGLKTRLLPASLRNGRSPWLALPVGFLFGFGFETSSQIAAYALAFSADAGVAGAVLVGSMFCVGMACTDTLDSMLVHRIASHRAGELPNLMRVWIWSVTLLAVAVAVYELLQLLGVRPPLSEPALSGAIVGSLLAVFIWVCFSTRNVPATRQVGQSLRAK